MKFLTVTFFVLVSLTGCKTMQMASLNQKQPEKWCQSHAGFDEEKFYSRFE